MIIKNGGKELDRLSKTVETYRTTAGKNAVISVKSESPSNVSACSRFRGTNRNVNDFYLPMSLLVNVRKGRS